jgi:hypothetical protein
MNAAAAPDLTLDAFEAGTIDVEAFDHEAHVYVGWLYLERYCLLEAIDRYSAALKRLTAKLGIPGKYHETITWFFLVLINERRAETKSSGWFAFRRENPDLCLEAGKTLQRHYSKDVLASELAKSTFVLPDRPSADT